MNILPSALFLASASAWAALAGRVRGGSHGEAVCFAMMIACVFLAVLVL